ncbi:MAG TPA: hypothetical protein VFQ78_08190 [Candidatus Udaeobacter sp.]|nr:hypothetical protein [Candidatus Udaeobacter sp.]
MKKLLLFAFVTAGLTLVPMRQAGAQVSVGVGVGGVTLGYPAYGYYGYPGYYPYRYYGGYPYYRGSYYTGPTYYGHRVYRHYRHHHYYHH